MQLSIDAQYILRGLAMIQLSTTGKWVPCHRHLLNVREGSLRLQMTEMEGFMALFFHGIGMHKH